MSKLVNMLTTHFPLKRSHPVNSPPITRRPSTLLRHARNHVCTSGWPPPFCLKILAPWPRSVATAKHHHYAVVDAGLAPSRRPTGWFTSSCCPQPENGDGGQPIRRRPRFLRITYKPFDALDDPIALVGRPMFAHLRVQPVKNAWPFKLNYARMSNF